MNAWRDPAPKSLARAAALAVVLTASCAGAAGAAPASGWVSAGLLAGTTMFDGHLGDYQWNLRPRAAFGAEVLAGTGRVSAGVRLWRAASEQQLGLDGAPDPAVHATTTELLARVRVAEPLGVAVLATASAGRLGLSWSPDRIEIPGSGSPVTVDFAPVHEWTGGAGLALERPVAGAWRAGLQVERRFFGLDTAHRSGTDVVMERESFGEWSARLSLAHVFGWR